MRYFAHFGAGGTILREFGGVKAQFPDGFERDITCEFFWMGTP